MYDALIRKVVAVGFAFAVSGCRAPIMQCVIGSVGKSSELREELNVKAQDLNTLEPQNLL